MNWEVSDMQALFLNSHELIDRHWWSVAKLVEPVVRLAARGEFDLEDLAALVVSGQAFAGLAMDGDTPVMGMVFEFRHYPAKTVINVMAIGGRDLAGVAMSFWPQFMQWAKESGASEIEACTSPAMTRTCKALGFAHTYDVIRCQLGEPT
jgi:hypothetical protein